MAHNNPSSSAGQVSFHSYIPPQAAMREPTPRAVIMGALQGVVFGASSLYLVLKVGITVSASIPVAAISPEMPGVGHIVGPRIASIVVADGVLNALVLIPMIQFFGEHFGGTLAPGSKPIDDMTPGDIRGAYVLCISACAAAAGGIISLARSSPTILHGIRPGFSDFWKAAAARASVLRTKQNLSMKFVAAGVVVLIAAILAAPLPHMDLLGAILIVLFGFLLVTVSSRLTGEIGPSCTPLSSVTVAPLLLTCLIFLIVGETGGTYRVTALSIGGIVCIAASNPFLARPNSSWLALLPFAALTSFLYLVGRELHMANKVDGPQTAHTR